MLQRIRLSLNCRFSIELQADIFRLPMDSRIFVLGACALRYVIAEFETAIHVGTARRRPR